MASLAHRPLAGGHRLRVSGPSGENHGEVVALSWIGVHPQHQEHDVDLVTLNKTTETAARGKELQGPMNALAPPSDVVFDREVNLR